MEGCGEGAFCWMDGAGCRRERGWDEARVVKTAQRPANTCLGPRGPVPGSLGSGRGGVRQGTLNGTPGRPSEGREQGADSPCSVQGCGLRAVSGRDPSPLRLRVQAQAQGTGCLATADSVRGERKRPRGRPPARERPLRSRPPQPRPTGEAGKASCLGRGGRVPTDTRERWPGRSRSHQHRHK